LLGSENLFLDSNNKIEENLKVGEKLIADLRVLSIQVFKKWSSLLKWQNFILRWAWKNPRNAENHTISEKFRHRLSINQERGKKELQKGSDIKIVLYQANFDSSSDSGIDGAGN